MRSLSIAFIIVLLAVACQTPIEPVPPVPDMVCSDTTSWHGLVPGLSTREDVIKVLGQPMQSGSRQYIKGSISFFAYAIEPGGIVAHFSQDRIFFRNDGVIAWIEVTRADRDGKFHSASEVVNQLGKTLDVAYINNNYNPDATWQYDILSGPDQLYVWSACGMALDVISPCWVAKSGSLGCSVNDRQPSPQGESNLTFRYPNPYRDESMALNQVSLDNVILMEFLFPPTTYTGFTDNYMHKIPYGLWRDYLYEVRPK